MKKFIHEYRDVFYALEHSLLWFAFDENPIVTLDGTRKLNTFSTIISFIFASVVYFLRAFVIFQSLSY